MIIPLKIFENALKTLISLQTHDHGPLCVPIVFFTPQKSSMDISSYIIVMYKTVRNQLKKKSVIGLTKFAIVNMAGKCHKHTILVKKIWVVKIWSPHQRLNPKG